LPAYRDIDGHVADCVRHFLARRYKVRGRSYTEFPDMAIFGKLGVILNPGVGGTASPEVIAVTCDFAASPFTQWVTTANRPQQLQRIVNAELSLLEPATNCRF